MIAPRILNDIVRELDPTIDDHPDQPFSFVTSPCDRQIFWRHRELVQRLLDVLESSFEKHGSQKARRKSTDADHAEKAEAAKEFLSGRMSEQIMLTDVAREVGASPFNFARIFQRHTGLPIHRYLTLLRLRASLEQLSDDGDDLTAVALDLGFSSHSHFTDVFKREFGIPPSEARSRIKRNELREMSKNLIAE